MRTLRGLINSTGTCQNAIVKSQRVHFSAGLAHSQRFSPAKYSTVVETYYCTRRYVLIRPLTHTHTHTHTRPLTHTHTQFIRSSFNHHYSNYQETSIQSKGTYGEIVLNLVIHSFISFFQIHPIFMLSIADCLLSLTWIVGGALWLLGGVRYSERVACFTVTLCTVVRFIGYCTVSTILNNNIVYH